jgi:signal transduction histidine kinase
LNYSCFDLAEIVSRVRDQFNLAHGPRIESSGEPVTGWWGRDELQRALENLVSNAIKYGKPEGPVKIIHSSEHGRMLLSVHNEGSAIPPDQVEALFQVFRRAKAAKDGDKQGWGIGLPYVRSVAESHGGSIDVDSSDALGTTFTIDLPLDSRPYKDAPVLPQH